MGTEPEGLGFDLLIVSDRWEGPRSEPGAQSGKGFWFYCKGDPAERRAVHAESGGDPKSTYHRKYRNTWELT